MTPMTQHTSLMSPMPSSPFLQFPPMPPGLPPPPPSHVRTVYTYTLPHNFTAPPSASKVHQSYQIRPCEIPPMTNWKPDVDFHDTTKIDGLDFPSTIRSSRFSQYMDPLQVPLWKFLSRIEQQLATPHCLWPRCLCHPL